MSKIYEPYSQNQNGMNAAQQRFIEQQNQRREQRQAYQRPRNRGQWARRLFTGIAVACFLLICVGAGLILNVNNDPVSKPTEAAIMMNTPQATTTLQSAAWEVDETEPEKPAANHDDGFVIVPDGFWQIPGMVEAYRAGTPVSELVAQYGNQGQTLPLPNNPQIVQVTPDPRIEQAKNDLTVAQIEAQIEAANLGPQMTATVMAAEAFQTVTKKQAITDRLVSNGRLAIDIISWLIIIVIGAAFFRLVGLALIDWLIGGLIDFGGNIWERFRFWAVELRKPVIEVTETQPEISERLREIPVNHHGSVRRQALRLPEGVTREQAKIILATWEATKDENGKGNLTECQRQAFGKDESGNWRIDGAFHKKARAVIDKYADQSPTTSGLTPYMG